MNASRHPQMTAHQLGATFAALADPTRREILARLARGAASVTELAAPFAMSQPAISKHLKVLERAGLISRGRAAQRRPRRLEPRRLHDATRWLERYRRVGRGDYRRLDALREDRNAKEAGEALNTLVLVEKGGRTTLTQTMRYESKEAREAVLKSGMESGVIASYDRLDAVLASAATKG